MLRLIQAQEVNVGDVLEFFSALYVVESVTPSEFGDGTPCIDMVFKNTNDGMPYSYGPTDEMYAVVRG